MTWQTYDKNGLLKSALASDTPVGTIVDYAGATIPAGWLACDGSAISRAVYTDLFASIGTLHGSGDGSTTFNIPDLRGRVTVGYASSGGHTDVSTLGANDGVSASLRRPKHKHTVNDPGHAHTVATSVADTATSFGSTLMVSGGSITTSTNTTGITVGTSTDSLDAPAYLVVNKIIRWRAGIVYPITANPTSQILYDSGAIGAAAPFIDTGVMTVPSWVNHLRYEFIGASAAAGLDYLRTQFNGDTGTNYLWGDAANTNAQLQASLRGSFLGYTTMTSGGYVLSQTLLAPWAAQTLYWKRTTQNYLGGDSSTAAVASAIGYGGVWKNTAPINRVKVFTESGSNLIAGSRLLVYGDA